MAVKVLSVSLCVYLDVIYANQVTFLVQQSIALCKVLVEIVLVVLFFSDLIFDNRRDIYVLILGALCPNS